MKPLAFFKATIKHAHSGFRFETFQKLERNTNVTKTAL